MKKKIVYIGIFFIVMSCFLFYFYGFTRTDSSNLSLTVYDNNDAQWEMTGIKDGKETTIGPIRAVNFDGTAVLKRTIPESWEQYSRVNVDSNRAICIFVDDVLVFSNYKTTLTKPGELPLMQMTEEQPSTLVFSFNPNWVGKEITLLTRLYKDQQSYSIRFDLINDSIYLDQHEASVNSKALPGAMFGLLSLLLFGVFLFQLATEKKGYPTLMLAIASLLQTFISMASLQQNPLPAIDEGFATALYFLLPLLYLGTKLIKNEKRYLIEIIIIWSIYFIIYMAIFVFQIPLPYWIDRVELICILLIAITIYYCIKEYKYNTFAQQFIHMLGLSLITYLLIFTITSVTNLHLNEYIKIIFIEASSLYFRPLLFWVFTTILFVLFILTIWEVLQNRIRSQEEINEIKLYSNLLSVQMDSASKQIEFLETSQKQSVIYRHDMRHHFSLIRGFLAEGEIQKAEDYVAQAQKDIEAITPTRYCENNTVNLILSSFDYKAKAANVTLCINTCLPAQLSIPETDLCSVLSNGLENAITAAALVDDSLERKVSLRCLINEGKLLISIENTYSGTVTLKNGLPQTDTKNHGFGTKSIELIAEKRHGYCTFEVTDKLCILRFMIPLD